MYIIDQYICLTVAVALSLSATETQAEYHYYYACPKYAGGVAIGEEVLGLQFFDERPKIGDVSGGRYISLSRFEYKECSNERFFCISKKNADSPFIAAAPIVVPKVVDVDVKYEYMGLVLEARPVARERYKQKRAAQLVVQRTDGQSGDWYSLTVVEGVGVVDFYISSVQAAKSATGDPLEIKGLTCYLDSRKGIFSKVKVNKISPATLY